VQKRGLLTTVLEPSEPPPRVHGPDADDGSLQGAQAFSPPLVEDKIARLPAEFVAAQGVVLLLGPPYLVTVVGEPKRLKDRLQSLFWIPHEMLVVQHNVGYAL